MQEELLLNKMYADSINSVQFPKQIDVMCLPTMQASDMQPGPLRGSPEQISGYNHPDNGENIFDGDVSMQSLVRALVK
jgi:hypothetical protein